jgi:hypothetical protein
MLHATAHWKATVLLHNQQKFHKIPKKITIAAAYPPRPSKSHFGLQRSLGVKQQLRSLHGS